jgi:hypothetical protein
MFICNITKYSEHTTHYYASLYEVSSHVDIDSIYAGYYTITDSVFTKLEIVHGNSFAPIKSINEKSLIRAIFNNINHIFDDTWLIIFNDGKFSSARTAFAESCANDILFKK